MINFVFIILIVRRQPDTFLFCRPEAGDYLTGYPVRATLKKKNNPPALSPESRQNKKQRSLADAVFYLYFRYML
jgi:hypothetical protein